MSRAYWLDLFTGTTWAEFLAKGGTVSGFRLGRKAWASRIKPGDYLLCYLTYVSRFIGILEVASELFEDDEPIWKDEPFPIRFRVKLVTTLTPEAAVPAKEILTRFSWYKPGIETGAWGAHFLGSPTPMSAVDGEMVVQEIRAAEADPVLRPVDDKKLDRRPGKGRPHFRKQGSAASADLPVVIPEVSLGSTSPSIADTGAELPGSEESPSAEDEAGTVVEVNAHTEIESLLLRIGSAMGLQLWVDPADRGKVHEGTKLGDIPGVLDELPLPFTVEVLKTIRRIDVLWLKDQMVVGAFEVESTTAVYSGLLRMSDLIAINPNVRIPIFIVAPDARADRVRQEIVRPTFARLFKPSMGTMSTLRAVRQPAQAVCAPGEAKRRGLAAT